ncbi:C1 family peptidase [Paenibacillus sp. Root444D2]
MQHILVRNSWGTDWGQFGYCGFLKTSSHKVLYSTCGRERQRSPPII